MVARVHLAGLASLRDSGRIADAEADARQCEAQSADAPDLLLQCLTAQAETALAVGRAVAARKAGVRVVAAAETRWGKDSAGLVGPLLLLARATAAAGDAPGAASLCDRAERLLPSDGSGRLWVEFTKGALLAQAGDVTAAQPILRGALEAGERLDDSGLVVAATSALAAQMISVGAGQQAIELWEAALPFTATGTPSLKVAVLRGLGYAAEAVAREPGAARFFGQAAAMSRQAQGAGNPVYGELIAAQAQALARSGEWVAASDALRLLADDPSPAASRVRATGLMRLSLEANDPAAAVVHARRTLDLARAASGAGSVGEAFAELDLAEAQALAGEHPDETGVAIAAVRAENPGWRGQFRIERLNGLLAAQAGRFEESEAAFGRAESVAAAHEGAGSLAVALERASRACVLLESGHAHKADGLFREALASAAPDGQWRNPVWARIAVHAATAADRIGDHDRAADLQARANGLLPAAPVGISPRWL